MMSMIMRPLVLMACAYVHLSMLHCCHANGIEHAYACACCDLAGIAQQMSLSGPACLISTPHVHAHATFCSDGRYVCEFDDFVLLTRANWLSHMHVHASVGSTRLLLLPMAICTAAACIACTHIAHACAPFSYACVYMRVLDVVTM